MSTAPTAAAERHAHIDVLRGFALFGILLVNLLEMNSPKLFHSAFSVPRTLGLLDQGIEWFFQLFVYGKFVIIFSFLFGLGFHLFMSRAEQKVQRVRWLFARRLLGLALFAVLHFVFLWYGDILHTYVLAGLLLLLFYGRKTKTILIWALSLLGLWTLAMGGALLVPAEQMARQQVANEAAFAQAVPVALDVYHNGSYVDWFQHHLRVELPTVLVTEPIFVMVALMLFLFGIYVGRTGVLEKIQAHRALIKRVWLISLAAAIPLLAVHLLILSRTIDLGVHHALLRNQFPFVTGLALSPFYMTSVLLLMMTRVGQNWLSPLRFMGQMALTNYISMTVVAVSCVFLFDLYGRMSLLQGVLFSAALYALLAVGSYLWLQRFRFGPLEWVWRCLTYGRLQPMRKTEAVGARMAG
ncbi:MAG: DUF418 domain-containing protein [Bacillota bacterium]